MTFGEYMFSTKIPHLGVKKGSKSKLLLGGVKRRGKPGLTH